MTDWRAVEPPAEYRPPKVVWTMASALGGQGVIDSSWGPVDGIPEQEVLDALLATPEYRGEEWPTRWIQAILDRNQRVEPELFEALGFLKLTFNMGFGIRDRIDDSGAILEDLRRDAPSLEKDFANATLLFTGQVHEGGESTWGYEYRSWPEPSPEDFRIIVGSRRGGEFDLDDVVRELVRAKLISLCDAQGL